MKQNAVQHPPAQSLKINLRVDDLSRLFEPFDASALVGRHLDERVEKFIIHRAQERPGATYALLIQYSRRGIARDGDLSASIREHFAHCSAEVTTEIAALISEGTTDLLIGLSFLFLCALLGLTSEKLLPSPLGLFVEQGLLIIGWVALWRPLDLFLYELRPLRSRRVMMEGLAHADLQFEHY